MPEGDTVHKIANYLAPKLKGQQVAAVTTRSRGKPSAHQNLKHSKVVEVRAQGKHLFLDLSNGHSIRSHLGMHGSWHRYPQGQPWQKPQWQASLVVTCGEEHYVCFNAREVEIIATPSVRNTVVSTRTGPDLAAHHPSLDSLIQQIVSRVNEMATADTPLIDLLLDQRVASGIGNVYKSEVLFIQSLPPETRLSTVTTDQLGELYLLAHQLLTANLGGGRRVTRKARDSAGRLWVYRRAGLLCHQCQQPIAYARLGRHHRSTYWCPRCQAGPS